MRKKVTYEVGIVSESMLHDVEFLFKRVFPDHPDPSKYLRWKYLENPFGPALCSYAYTNDGVIKAFLGAIPVPFKVGSSVFMAAQMVDAMKDPGFKPEGLLSMYIRIYRNLFNLCEEIGVPLLYGFPSEAALKVGIRAGGFPVVRTVGFYKYVNSGFESRTFLQLLNSIKKVAGYKTRLFSVLRSCLCKIENKWPKKDILGKICNSFNSSIGSGVLRLPEYLEWRYKYNPTAEYLPLLLRSWFSRNSVLWILRYDIRNKRMMYLERIGYNSSVEGCIVELILIEKYLRHTIDINWEVSYSKFSPESFIGNAFLKSKYYPIFEEAVGCWCNKDALKFRSIENLFFSLGDREDT